MQLLERLRIAHRSRLAGRALCFFLCLAGCVASVASPTAPAPAGLHDLGRAQQFFTAYSPKQIQVAYDFIPLYQKGIDGSGQTVALLEIDGLNRNDLSRFDTAYHVTTPQVKEFYVGGRFVTRKGGETATDVEWLHALAPGAAIQIYYLDDRLSMSQLWKDMARALRKAAAHGASAVSISLGACGPSLGYQAVASALADVTAGGVSVFVSSGDSGDHPGPVDACGRTLGVTYPGGDPSVVSVGGTSLHLNVSGSIASEVAWSLSGGGRAATLPRPDWQVAGQMPQDSDRWAPDVAFEADPHTGLASYFNGDWYKVGGTSLGAPAWAAAWALIEESGQQAGSAVESAAPFLYGLGNSPQYTTVFHDITKGSNGRYHAQPGWDAVTGWGTPDVAALAKAAADGAATGSYAVSPSTGRLSLQRVGAG